MKLSSTDQRASLTKRQLQARYTKEAKARLTRALEELREAKRAARKQGQLSAPRLRSLCRGSVKRARVRGRQIITSALEKARAEARELVASARRGCDRRKERELRAAGRHLQALELEAQRAKERYIAERLGSTLARQAKAARSTSAERRQESDDEVRRNISPELVPVFEAVRKQVRAVPGKSRTEAFEQWVEENADDVVAIFSVRAEQAAREEIARLEKRDKALRAMLKRNVVRAADLKALGLTCDDVEAIGGDCDAPADVEATIERQHAPRRRRRDVEHVPF